MRASAAGYTSAIPRSRFTERQRWLIFAAAATAIVLLAFGGAYALARSAASDAPSRWTSRAQGAKPASGIQLVPYSDARNGFTVQVPEGWTSEWQDKDKTRVKFFEDATESVFLQLYVQKVGTRDQQKVWEAGERYQQGRVQQYERVKFAPAKIGGQNAVDWEWRFTTRSGQRRHVLDRGIIINGTSYQLYFSAPEERFAAGVGVLDEVSKSFRLTS